MGRTGSDLWGWTCSDKADSIQAEFAALVNFSRFCDIQVSPVLRCLSHMMRGVCSKLTIMFLADWILVREYSSSWPCGSDCGGVLPGVEKAKA